MNVEVMEVEESLGQVDGTGADEEHLSVYLTNDCEYKGKRLQTNSNVPGMLLSEEFATFYQDVIGAPEEVVRVCH